MISRRRFCGLLGGLALAGPESRYASPARCAPPLGGTFLQPTLADLDREPAYWRELFQQLRALGLSQVFVQYLRYGPDSLERLVAPLAKAAAATGIGLHLGLSFDPAYWRLIGAPEAELARHLARWRATSLELAERVLASAIPAGWYLPEEIDDIAWNGRSALLVEHLALSVSGLARLGGDRPVAISTFVGGGGREEFLELWRRVWAVLDLTVMLQDGQGVGKLPQDRLRPYLDGLSADARRFGRRWAIVIEMFEQLSDAPFAARPAELSRVIHQIAEARRFPEAGRVAFAAREYMLARPADGTASLAEQFLDHTCRF